jgi:hypothetical protein
MCATPLTKVALGDGQGLVGCTDGNYGGRRRRCKSGLIIPKGASAAPAGLQGRFRGPRWTKKKKEQIGIKHTAEYEEIAMGIITAGEH